MALSADGFMAMLGKYRGHARNRKLAASPIGVLEALPTAEAAALSDMQVPLTDFVGSFDAIEDITSAVGPCSAAVWKILNDVRRSGSPSSCSHALQPSTVGVVREA